ncbi:hypothetical protein [Mucilaginibacter agri]|uniref:Uncharacterized protein n=1 Tax=Mucilaginibacter agri TaxID=2695265 RepID=A0A965ZF89_9SPHI|nr:hypothetical protein [Mucilaginibacter agri]NCD69012.1 hypothetical protein [Mucilaginibacter agri]
MISIISFISLFCHLWLQQPSPVKRKHLSEPTKQRFDRQKRHKDYYDDCVFTKQYSIRQRLKKYPFVKTSVVVAVSYHAEMPEPSTYVDNNGKVTSVDSAWVRPLAGLHIKNGKIDTKTLTEFVALNKQQIDALTNIIYNTDFRINKDFNMISQGSCFEPRNALIFLDKNGNAFDYIEICFQCKDSKSFSQKLNIGTPCTQKYDILKKYFIRLDIKTGTLQK